MKPKLEHAYKTLGVAFGAPDRDVRSAADALIRAYQGDRNTGGQTAANRHLAEIIAARFLIDHTPRVLIQGDPVTLRARREAEARAVRKAREAIASARAQAEANTRNRPMAAFHDRD